jgi:hypothetical protein
MSRIGSIGHHEPLARHLPPKYPFPASHRGPAFCDGANVGLLSTRRLGLRGWWDVRPVPLRVPLPQSIFSPPPKPCPILPHHPAWAACRRTVVGCAGCGFCLSHRFKVRVARVGADPCRSYGSKNRRPEAVIVSLFLTYQRRGSPRGPLIHHPEALDGRPVCRAAPIASKSCRPARHAVEWPPARDGHSFGRAKNA